MTASWIIWQHPVSSRCCIWEQSLVCIGHKAEHSAGTQATHGLQWRKDTCGRGGGLSDADCQLRGEQERGIGIEMKPQVHRITPSGEIKILKHKSVKFTVWSEPSLRGSSDLRLSIDLSHIPNVNLSYKLDLPWGSLSSDKTSMLTLPPAIDFSYNLETVWATLFIHSNNIFQSLQNAWF